MVSCVTARMTVARLKRRKCQRIVNGRQGNNVSYQDSTPLSRSPHYRHNTRRHKDLRNP